MKRVQEIAAVLGLISVLALLEGCSQGKAPQPKEETTAEKVGSAPKEKDNPEDEIRRRKLEKSREKVVVLGKDVTLNMILIPAGKFMMGFIKIPSDPFSNKQIQQPWPDELPKHEVALTKAFFMGKTEVTQEQWFEVMDDNPSRIKGRRLPVTDVSWEDCQDFIKKLNAKINGGYRLPTEAEWEYACRAGTTTAYSFGDSITKSDANIEGDSIKAVGSYKPNAFGLYDMHGNVWEWCEDWYATYPARMVTDPKGLGGRCHVLRGGSFSYNIAFARSSGRGSPDSPYIRDFNSGFRLAETTNILADVVTQPKPNQMNIIPASGILLAVPFDEAMAKEVQKEVAKNLQNKVEDKEDLEKGINLEMVLIPSGKFMRGAPKKDNVVTLTKPFYMGKFEVTQEQWEAVMGNNPSSKTKGAKLPVTDVSWEDCQGFIKKLNAKTKGGYRLPTEAEWEYACRAGTNTEYSFGENITPKDANYKDSYIGKPVIVGSYKGNAFGLFDMHGNVWEWCEDWYGEYPVEEVTNPRGPATGEYRALRGGSFCGYESDARSSGRGDFTPTCGLNGDGFRLARTP